MPDQHLPHRNLFTRLMPSAGRGIGVFAIRDIPAGTNPFVGDRGDTVEVPVEEVDAIDDPELRRMYLDFCPVVNGSFVVPRDFNQITMSWYLNHSDEPNVSSDAEMTFRSMIEIARGQELTVDYRTFSERAERAICEGL